jgi:flagellar secretion chaperone FliS
MSSNLAASPNTYRQNAVLSARPEELVVMLYDGARRYLRQAAGAMRAGEVEPAHHRLRRAELIITHLDEVLDDERGGEISARLHSIYQFCLLHLNRARIAQDAGKVEEVGKLLGDLRGAWEEVARG